MLGAIVLGGGRSLRMGADKLALRRAVGQAGDVHGLPVRKLVGGLTLAHLAAPDAVTRDIDTPDQARSAGLT